LRACASDHRNRGREGKKTDLHVLVF
jgi:hypothetical protein